MRYSEQSRVKRSVGQPLANLDSVLLQPETLGLLKGLLPNFTSHRTSGFFSWQGANTRTQQTMAGRL